MATICIFGDSTTWGATDPKQGGWANRLRNHFERLGGDIEVYNLGISGDNTNDLLERIRVECEAREPSIIVFAIGINDSQYIKSKNNPCVSLDNFQNNLKKLLQIAQQFASKIIFIGVIKVDESKTMPCSTTKMNYYDNENIIKYNSAIKFICKENNFSFIETFDLLETTDLDDGLHPNSKGHEKMFEKIKSELKI